MSADTGARERWPQEEKLDRTTVERWRREAVTAPAQDRLWLNRCEALCNALAAGVGVPPDAGRVAELESALRQARANHLGDQRIANEMVNHFPVEIRCDHDTNRDKVFCDCARVDLGWHPSIRAAKEAWAAHVIEAVKGARAQAGVGEARPAEPPEEWCGYCGDLDWTKKHYGRLTHKHACPGRTDGFCQSHPEGCAPATEQPDARCEKCNGVGLIPGERDEWGFGKPCPECNGTGVRP